MGNHVFICYARKDGDFVLKLATNLKSCGVPVWLDQWDIPAGANYNRTIDEAIIACAYFLLVLSPRAVESVEVEGEWLMALEEKKTIVPVLYENCRVPRQLRALHRVDFSGRNLDDETLLSQVVRPLGRQQGTPVPPPKENPSAPEWTLNPEPDEGTKEKLKDAQSPSPHPFSEITNSIDMDSTFAREASVEMGERPIDRSAPPTILCVDDDKVTLRAIERSLVSNGYSVFTADSGASTLRILQKTRPDLILLDVLMPNMDGYEICSQLQTNPALSTIPILFVTAQDEEKAKALAVGAADYLVKPIQRDVLLRKIAQHIRKYE